MDGDDIDFIFPALEESIYLILISRHFAEADAGNWQLVSTFFFKVEKPLDVSHDLVVVTANAGVRIGLGINRVDTETKAG